MSTIHSLPIAVRVYPIVEGADAHVRSRKHGKLPNAMLVFDTETRIDAAQRLTFGSFRFFVNGRCLEEGLFYADDLPERDHSVLKQYVATHNADAVDKRLRLLTRREFAEIIFRAAYKGRSLLVGFNLPFDLSRIAYDFKPARAHFAGGFSLGIWSYIDESGQERGHRFRPRIAVKYIDRSRALIGFTGCKESSLHCTGNQISCSNNLSNSVPIS